jgi:hypothetical protein
MMQTKNNLNYSTDYQILSFSSSPKPETDRNYTSNIVLCNNLCIGEQQTESLWPAQHRENVLYYRYKDSRWSAIPINMVAKRHKNLIRLSTVLFLYFRTQIIPKELLSLRICETKRKVKDFEQYTTSYCLYKA